MIAWLLAGCSSHPAPPIEFEDVTEASGLEFEYFNGMSGQLTFAEITGGGVATLDYDRDGDADVYLSQGQNIHSPSDPAIRDRLYRNDSSGPGHLHFTDVTGESQIRAAGYGMGVAVGDIDNDGHLDIYSTNWGPNQLWRNNGDGTFTNATQSGVTDDPRWSISAAFADFDQDGWQDLITVNYVDYTLQSDHPCTSALSGRRDYCGPSAYDPVADRVLRNVGGGQFQDVTFLWGLAGARGAGLGVAVADFDLDGRPDIYVANDGEDNRLWMNQGGRFVDEAVLRGAAVNLRGLPEASMGVAVEDFDNDGDPDILLTHLNGETNTLYVNDGDGFFTDATRSVGIGPAGIAYTGFGVVARDFDRDGRVDLFVANGDVRILPDQMQAGDPFPLRQPNQLFRNGAEGFSEVAEWLATRPAEVTRGAAAADFDRDGRVDLIVSNIAGPARVLKNRSAVSSDWIGVHLAGPGVSGTRITIGELSRVVTRDGSYASSSSLEQVFPLFDTGPVTIHLSWPDGSTETRTSAGRNQYVTLFR